MDTQINLQDSFDSLQQSATGLSLLQAAIYENGRAHFVFSDNTSVILHEGGDCVTFFSKAGHKTRSLVKFVVNSTAKNDQQGVLNQLDKLIVALKFFNLYTHTALNFKRVDIKLDEVTLF